MAHMRQDDTFKEFIPFGDDEDSEFDRAPTAPFFRGKYGELVEEFPKYGSPELADFLADVSVIEDDFAAEPDMAMEEPPYSSADFSGLAEGSKQMSLKRQLSFADISPDEDWSKQMSREEC